MRIRVIYSKTGSLRYTSNLDMQRIWERLLRRAELHITYTQGFHPTPKLQQGCPLPLGLTSRCEVVDFSIDDEIVPLQLHERLQQTVVPGIDILSIQPLPSNEPALVTHLHAAEYSIKVAATPEQTRSLLMLMQTTSLVRERRGKTYDLRPLIIDISSQAEIEDCTVFKVVLSSKNEATGRPDEVLSAAGIDPNIADIERSALILSDGTRI
ncbi:MAG TPA: TIGR03936 family radical SAM-associated protein [Longilinea sp.]|nr:TIGR03936 family radical SAM-associated protein [Longilinea sp.]